VVNQALATRYLSGRDPIGRYVTLPGLRKVPEPVPDPTFEVVGVVADVRTSGIRDAPEPEVLVPSTTRAGPWRVILARTTGNPALALEAIRREVRAVDRGVALPEGGLLETAPRLQGLAADA